jgi:hypothetical protein
VDAYQVAASWIGNYIRQLQTRNICSLGSEFYFPARKPFLEQFYIHVVGTVIMDVVDHLKTLFFELLPE